MENRQYYIPQGDSQFARPYIDTDEWREYPLRHRYIHGGFEGTQTRFCFYYPEKEAYAGRFFHFMMPVQGPEDSVQAQTGEEDIVSFSLSHGAYFVQSNMGGLVNGAGDKTLVYRSSAQVAVYSRKIAVEIYGCGRPYGYLFGGSGGSLKTISCIENTTGIWDGAVPYVIGCPAAMPNFFTIRAHAMRILRNKMAQIGDAVMPGGGDPYAQLNEEEKDALREASAMGFPLESWATYQTMNEGALPVLYPTVPLMDPTYFEDFWTKEGYLGADPNSSAVRDRIHYQTEIVRIRSSEESLSGMAEKIDEGNSYGVDEAWKHQFGKMGKMPLLTLKVFPLPENGAPYTRGLTMRFLSGRQEGVTIKILWCGGCTFTGESDTSGRDLAEILSQVCVGDRVEIDNSDYIAVQTYHRHQVPSADFYVWDYFRNADGTPKYPQRPVFIGPIMAEGGAGSVQKGTPTCKIIVLCSHMDESAFPWCGDWYRKQVMENRGTDSSDIMRLWIMERCMHIDCGEGRSEHNQHIVSYLGALHQALLDLAEWVEKGIDPAATSEYDVVNGQMKLPETAEERKGIQPTARLTAESGCTKSEKDILTVRINQPITFTLQVDVTKATGNLEEVLWDFTASDAFKPLGTLRPAAWSDKGTGLAEAKAEFTFNEPGTYFPVAKYASNRTIGDPFTRIRNQKSMRIIVTV